MTIDALRRVLFQDRFNLDRVEAVVEIEGVRYRTTGAKFDQAANEVVIAATDARNDENRARMLRKIEEFRKIDADGNGYDAAVAALDYIEKILRSDTDGEDPVLCSNCEHEQTLHTVGDSGCSGCECQHFE